MGANVNGKWMRANVRRCVWGGGWGGWKEQIRKRKGAEVSGCWLLSVFLLDLLHQF